MALKGKTTTAMLDVLGIERTDVLHTSISGVEVSSCTVKALESGDLLIQCSSVGKSEFEQLQVICKWFPRLYTAIFCHWIPTRVNVVSCSKNLEGTKCWRDFHHGTGRAKGSSQPISGLVDTLQTLQSHSSWNSTWRVWVDDAKQH